MFRVHQQMRGLSRMPVVWRGCTTFAEFKGAYEAPKYDLGKEGQRAIRIATNLGLDVAKKHILVCADQTKPKCCNHAKGMEVWNHLKKRSKEINRGGKGEVVMTRSKVNCLQICAAGPICVVYPDGHWFHSCDKDVISRILAVYVSGESGLGDRGEGGKGGGEYVEELDLEKYRITGAGDSMGRPISD